MIKSLFASKSFFRFALVGGVSSFAYSLLVAILINRTDFDAFGISVLVFCAFIPVTYHTHRRFSFQSPVGAKHGLLMYGLLQVVCFSLISFVSSNLATGSLLADLALYFTTVTMAAVASFLIGQRFIFRQKL